MLKFDRLTSVVALFACVAAASQLTACGGDDTPAATPAPAPTATPAPTGTAPATPAPAPVTTPATPASPPVASVPAPATPAAPAASAPTVAAPPAAPVTAPTPSASGDCNLDGNIFTVAGNTAQMDNNIYDASGQTIAQRQQNKFSIRTGATFRAESGLTEINQDTTTVVSGVSVQANTKSYGKVNGANFSTYGVVNTSTAAGFTVASTIVLNPASAVPTSPALNTPYTNRYATTTDVNGAAQAPVNQTVVTTYEGIETISVPAGTFAACKIKTETTIGTAAPVTSFSWTVASGRLKGHVLRSTTGAGVRQLEATVLLVNGS